MKLPDKVYDVLKWVTMIVLPALAAAYTGLAAVWGWPYASEIAKTVTVVCTLLGALLGISTAQYNKDGVKELAEELMEYRGRHEKEEPIYGEPVEDTVDLLPDWE